MTSFNSAQTHKSGSRPSELTVEELLALKQQALERSRMEASASNPPVQNRPGATTKGLRTLGDGTSLDDDSFTEETYEIVDGVLIAGKQSSAFIASDEPELTMVEKDEVGWIRIN